MSSKALSQSHEIPIRRALHDLNLTKRVSNTLRAWRRMSECIRNVRRKGHYEQDTPTVASSLTVSRDQDDRNSPPSCLRACDDRWGRTLEYGDSMRTWWARLCGNSRDLVGEGERSFPDYIKHGNTLSPGTGQDYSSKGAAGLFPLVNGSCAEAKLLQPGQVLGSQEKGLANGPVQDASQAASNTSFTEARPLTCQQLVTTSHVPSQHSCASTSTQLSPPSPAAAKSSFSVPKPANDSCDPGRLYETGEELLQLAVLPDSLRKLQALTHVVSSCQPCKLQPTCHRQSPQAFPHVIASACICRLLAIVNQHECKAAGQCRIASGSFVLWKMAIVLQSMGPFRGWVRREIY